MADAAFVSTTIPYVNVRPHLGHAFEFAQADAYALHMAAQGHDLYFLSGSTRTA